MIINLFPARSDHPMSLERRGSQLIVNGTVVEIEGYAEEDSPAIIGRPVHDGTGWQVNMVLPHGGNAAAETLFPAPLLLEGDGPVILPPFEVVSKEYTV